MKQPYAHIAEIERLADRPPDRRPGGGGDGQPDNVTALPTVLADRAGRGSAHGAGRLPAPADGMVVDVYRMDAGRVPLEAACSRLGWQPGIRLDLQLDAPRLTISAIDGAVDPAGVDKPLGAGGRLGIPAGMRDRLGLDGTVAAVTDPAGGRVVLVDPRRLAALVVDTDTEHTDTDADRSDRAAGSEGDR